MQTSAKIMIVEDEFVVALDIQAALENFGYQVVGQSARGEEALVMAETLRPDLILMDIRLKGKMDGIEAARLVRKRFNIPVVFLTAHGDTGTLSRTEQVSPYGFLVKPYEDMELRATIEVALNQHRYERLLAASERKTRGIIENSADGILLTDSEGKIIEWNPAMERITGLDRAEVLGIAVWEVISRVATSGEGSPNNLERGRAYFETALREGLSASKTAFPDEYPILVRGERLYVETNGFGVESQGGVMLGAVIRDVTEKRKISQEIRLLSQAITQSANCVVITDLEGRIEFVNPRFSELTGYTAAEVIGKKPSVLKSGAHDEAHYRQLWATISAGETWQGELYNRRKDGTFFWEQSTISPVIEPDGKISHYIAIKEDITARKAAEDALRESEARYRTLVETSPDGVVLIDLEGRLISANPYVLRSLGVGRVEDLAPQQANLLAWVDESDREKVLQFLAEVIREGRGYHLQSHVGLQDGEHTPVEVNASLIRDSLNAPHAILAIIRDITDQKKLEQARLDRLATLGALYEVGREITGRLEPQKVYSATHQAVLRLLPAESLSIWWLNAETGDFEAVHRSSRTNTGVACEGGRELMERVLAAQRLCRVERQCSQGKELTSFLAVPLTSGERVVGVLEVGANGRNCFTDEHEHILGMIANQAAAAIQNAYLYEQTHLFSITDSMTGAYNMRQFMVLLKKDQERSDRFGDSFVIILADIDHFKRVNDTYGHAAGDQVLKAFVDTLRSSLRSVDVIARYGGEEFFFLLPHTQLEEGIAAADRLRLQLKELVTVVDGDPIRVTASFGVVEYRPMSVDMGKLMKRADQALYQAKNNGRDRVVAHYDKES